MTNMDSPSLLTVSYTHLDVYKRQEYDCEEKLVAQTYNAAIVTSGEHRRVTGPGQK